MGVETDQIAEALSAEPVSAGRLQVLERADGVTIINDAFNANTESMRAGLETLTSVAEGRRTVAVPGEMEEPGDTAEAPPPTSAGTRCMDAAITQLRAEGLESVMRTWPAPCVGRPGRRPHGWRGLLVAGAAADAALQRASYRLR